MIKTTVYYLQNNMKKILITGGTGYVGSRVAKMLSEKGYPVIVVDIVKPEERDIEFTSGIEFRHHDLRIPTEAIKAFQGADLVLHLAADIGSLTYMHDHQAEILTNNSAIDTAVYPALVENKIPWIIYSSSSMVFQHTPRYPYKEDDISEINPPTNVYGFSKLGGEYFCKSFYAQYNINYTIVRYHNIYGPGEDSKGASPGDIHVIPALLEKVLGGQYPIEFLGDPQSTRHFVYVDDAVLATVQIVIRAVEGDPMVCNEDFNIGNDKHYTILELGKIIWKNYGDDREFHYSVTKTNANTSLRRESDITKIKNKIGWFPRISLEEGLKPTAEWIKNRAKGKL